MDTSLHDILDAHTFLWGKGYQNGDPDSREITAISRIFKQERGICEADATTIIRHLKQEGRIRALDKGGRWAVFNPEKVRTSVNVDPDPAVMVGGPGFLDRVNRFIEKVAPTSKPILITGETGVGKELVAGAIHQASGRTGAYLQLNCGGLPEELIESELFGHKKGAFTNAGNHHAGWLKRADHGTLLLDEIGNASWGFQGKLLRFLETGEFTPVGGEMLESVDVRIIASTNSDLETEVRSGKFRKDLYFRLRFLAIEIPPLRLRGREDISLLVNRFLWDISNELALAEVPQLTDAALNRLMGYSWPGNIRELKNSVEAAVILSDRKTIRPEDFFLTTKLER